VVAWEPVPTFRAFLQYGVELNGLGGLVDVRAAAVGDKPGAEYELVVPQRGIWGTASIGGRNIDKCARARPRARHARGAGRVRARLARGPTCLSAPQGGPACCAWCAGCGAWGPGRGEPPSRHRLPMHGSRNLSAVACPAVSTTVRRGLRAVLDPAAAELCDVALPLLRRQHFS